MVDVLPQLRILSIGVSDYQADLSLPSATFDSLLVANKFDQRGFTKTHLMNPTAEEVKDELRFLKSQAAEISTMKTSTTITSFMIVYFVGYADSENNIILSNGDKINLERELTQSFIEIKNTHLLIF